MYSYYSSIIMLLSLSFLFFFFNDPATTEIYTLSLHDALPIAPLRPSSPASRAGAAHIHPARSARVWPRRRAADQSSGRPSCSELIPPHAPRKSPSSRRLRSGGQGEWSEHTIDRSPAARAVQSRSWLTAERIGGGALERGRAVGHPLGSQRQVVRAGFGADRRAV